MSEVKKEEKMDRRKYIKYVGAGAVVAAAAAAIGYGVSELTKPPPPTPTTVVQTVVKTETLPGTTIVRTEERTVVQTAVTTVPTTVVATSPKKTFKVWAISKYVEEVNNYLALKLSEWGKKNNIDVEITWVTFAEQTPKLVAAIEAKTLPDLMYIEGPALGAVAEEGKPKYVIPVDDLINEVGKDDFYEQWLDFYKMEGKHYLFPIDAFANLTHIIKPMLESVGIKEFPDSKGPIPKSWDDWEEFAKAYKKKFPDKPVFGLTLGPGAGDGSESWEMVWWPYGGALMKSQGKAGITFKSEATYRTLERFLDWWDKGYFPKDAFSTDGFYNNNCYLAEITPMIVEGPTPYYAAVTRNPELAGKTILTGCPSGPAGSITYTSEDGFIIFKDSPNQDLAKDFILYFVKDKDAFMDGFIKPTFGGLSPVFKSIGEKLKAFSPTWKFIIEDIEKCKPANVSWTYNLPSKAADTIHWDFTYPTMLSRALIDRIPIDSAIEEAYKHIVEVFESVYGY
jgi:multiple sugar transport system substrate-binding protein